MRDDVGILNRTPSSDHRSNGLPTRDAPPTSFTAVNGDAHRSGSHRPEAAAARPIILPPPVEQITNHNNNNHSHNHNNNNHNHNHNNNDNVTSERATTSLTGPYQAHSWRPTEQQGTAAHEAAAAATAAAAAAASSSNDTHKAASNKRKRAPSSSAEELREDSRRQQPNAGADSLERRAHDDDHRDDVRESRGFRDGHGELEESTTGPYVRVDSPARGPPGPAPPAPRPETEAALAAQVAQVQQFSGHAQTRPGSSGSPEEAQARQRSHPHGSEQGQSVDDRSKRKRNFSNRTKTGCHTCRKRKKKCDEGKPYCQNCARGSFECEGYGPKPVGGSKTGPTRSVVPLQSKTNEGYAPIHDQHYGFEPAPYHDPPPRPLPPGGERYALSLPRVHDIHTPRYTGPTPASGLRPTSAREGYAPWHDLREGPSTAPRTSPDVPRPPPHAHRYPPPPPPIQYPYLPPSEPWHAPPPPIYPPLAPVARTILSSHESVFSGGSGSHRSYPMSHSNPEVPDSERAKMLRGEPYLHFHDPDLKEERLSCLRAVETYNDSRKGSSIAPGNVQSRNFQDVYDPAARAWGNGLWNGPKGTVGSHTVVEAPVTCEFGYNIHLGNDVHIQQNCTLQDASIIYIGDRTIIGPNVKFYCITTSMDINIRQQKSDRDPLKRGPRFEAGPIRVEDDVVIHADCIILPFRTIGKGAVVGAGSVVTRDVKPYTVVAGNPAKPVKGRRKLAGGPEVDRHCEDIQEQNDAMLARLRNNEVIPRDDLM
ncbi:putative acetyltransferase [Sphaerulina musiva]